MKLTAGKQILILRTLLEADAENNFQLTASQLGVKARELNWFKMNTKAGQCLDIAPVGSKTFYRLRSGYEAIARGYLTELSAPSPVPLYERLKILDLLDISFPDSLLHKRIAAALLQNHSKETLTAATLYFLAEKKIRVQHDALLRLRSNAKLRLEFICGRIEDVIPSLSINGELILSDSALSQILRISNAENKELKLITIENHAAYCHFALQSTEVAVFQPGFDDRQVKILLEKLNFVRRSHFGDLDQQGIEIALRHIPLHSTPVELVLPKQEPLMKLLSHFALPITDETEIEGMRKNWYPEVFPDNLQHYLAPLITKKQWLEQEVLALLPRSQLFSLELRL